MKAPFSRRVRLALGGLLAAGLGLASFAAGGASAPPQLAREHRHPAAGFVFRTPESWTVAEVAGRPGAMEASAGTLRVRFLWHKGDQGFDAAHVLCMLERFSPSMEVQPQMSYEYDFISGEAGGRRFLDSAFEIHYDRPVMGAKDWRQRAFTIVGDDGALCIVSAAPHAAWKKASTRALMDGILGSVTFGR